ncbi:MAG: RND family efflux transporter MFP subunit [Gammaproteobacteria bacterium]|jgi:RND family efflux transporter MFP subunit
MCAVAMLLVVGGSVRAQSAADKAASILPIKALRVQHVDHYQVEESYAGRIVSRRSSNLGFERGGRIAEMLVEEGDRVLAKDVLARLGTRRIEAHRVELAAQLEHSRAVSKEIETRLAFARSTVKRNESLRERKQLSAQAYDESQAEARALSAQLAAARANVTRVDASLGVLAVDMDQSTLLAPYAGSIVARFAHDGTAVDAGQPVLELIEDRKLQVYIGVAARAVVNLVPNETYSLDVEGREYPAELRTLLPRIDPRTRTVNAIFSLQDPDGSLRPGQLARLRMMHRIDTSGFWLPLTALSESRRGLWSVFVLESSEQGAGLATLNRRELQLLHSEAERAFVRGTLRDGERIGADGLHRLVAGQLVRVVE